MGVVEQRCRQGRMWRVPLVLVHVLRLRVVGVGLHTSFTWATLGAGMQCTAGALPAPSVLALVGEASGVGTVGGLGVRGAANWFTIRAWRARTVMARAAYPVSWLCWLLPSQAGKLVGGWWLRCLELLRVLCEH